MTTRHASTVSPVELLSEYRAGSSFFFSSPRGVLLAEGVAAAVPSVAAPGELRALPGRVAQVLAEAEPGALVVGAVPFDHNAAASLVVPEAVRRAEPFSSEVRLPELSMNVPEWEITPVPEPAAYVRSVRAALTPLGSGELDKVVLARSLALTAPTTVDLGRLLNNLIRRDPAGYSFAADLPSRTLIGASPELLLSRRGGKVLSNPLAGSAARSADPEEDQRRAAALLVSAKDRHEHAVVVDAVAAALRPYCRTLDVPAAPELVRTATMWHLSTRVTGELADERSSALELAAALHPTPAVCGTPVQTARDTINALEPFDRGFYTGMVGWCDGRGDGDWVVTIRCAEADDHSLRLFAGAGIVGDSSPEAELAETAAKFRTLLLAMGIEQIA
ncbi:MULTISPECIES: isochorismate synthase DhbC [unclassified Crossiella]|uniref:isochorismate synthase DhbC n=1 Tax=unclassified Crossiella TaxID=2620835 RepID=UPI001FFF305A|nr:MULTISPECIES: isochorismate synthase DhbC [unclassified Crossiella]MCK2243998.1 isochorismate synthase DhbC [Crossiella sp. S99.2]MCK2257144.1 isochorismate synthase DhbC [Crossiella sp. S99.1]